MEQVWWPAFGHFNHLHPEYEVNDFRDGFRYLDFAYIQSSIREIEIDGFGPHLQRISRTQFSDQWIRQNHLVIDGWKILRFSFDDVKERPRMCEQLLQQFMGRWLGGVSFNPILSGLTPEEKEILRLAIRTNRSLVPNDVRLLLDVAPEKARKLLHTLLTKGLLVSGGSGKERIRCYRLAHGIAADWAGL